MDLRKSPFWLLCRPHVDHISVITPGLLNCPTALFDRVIWNTRYSKMATIAFQMLQTNAFGDWHLEVSIVEFLRRIWGNLRFSRQKKKSTNSGYKAAKKVWWKKLETGSSSDAAISPQQKHGTLLHTSVAFAKIGMIMKSTLRKCLHIVFSLGD